MERNNESHFEIMKRGFSNLVDEFKEWNRKRRLVTDQAVARKERVEIEARREAQREAFNEYLEEYREEVSQEEFEREIDRLRDDSSHAGPRIPGLQPPEGGEQFPDFTIDFEEQYQKSRESDGQRQ